MSDYIIDLPFLSQSAGTRWHKDCSGYFEECDVCRDCLKAHGKVIG